jgi:hypothetical protein
VSDTLTLRRLWLLLRSDAITDYRFVGMSAAAIAALLFLFSLPERSSGQFYVGWFATLLFTLGPIYVSASFRELHDKSRNEAYLLLPASALEKTLARLLRSSVGFVAFLLIIVTVGSFVNEGAKWLLLDRSAPVFNPFALGVWQAIGVFVPVQAMFFLRAVQRHHRRRAAARALQFLLGPSDGFRRGVTAIEAHVLRRAAGLLLVRRLVASQRDAG